MTTYGVASNSTSSYKIEDEEISQINYGDGDLSTVEYRTKYNEDNNYIYSMFNNIIYKFIDKTKEISGYNDYDTLKSELLDIINTSDNNNYFKNSLCKLTNDNDNNIIKFNCFYDENDGNLKTINKNEYGFVIDYDKTNKIIELKYNKDIDNNDIIDTNLFSYDLENNAIKSDIIASSYSSSGLHLLNIDNNNKINKVLNLTTQLYSMDRLTLFANESLKMCKNVTITNGNQCLTYVEMNEDNTYSGTSNSDPYMYLAVWNGDTNELLRLDDIFDSTYGDPIYLNATGRIHINSSASSVRYKTNISNNNISAMYLNNLMNISYKKYYYINDLKDKDNKHIFSIKSNDLAIEDSLLFVSPIVEDLYEKKLYNLIKFKYIAKNDIKIQCKKIKYPYTKYIKKYAIHYNKDRDEYLIPNAINQRNFLFIQAQIIKKLNNDIKTLNNNQILLEDRIDKLENIIINNQKKIKKL